MEEFLLAGLLGCVLIAVCCLNIYELLRYIWAILPKLTWQPRLRVVAVLACTFIAHILNIWLFGFVYYVMHCFHLGELTGPSIQSGQYTLDIYGYMYFSSVIYSTLGLGDITPVGPLRMITGVESLTGIILIGWTISFSYLTMQKFWELPHSRRK